MRQMTAAPDTLHPNTHTTTRTHAQALAFLVFDRVGMIVEEALKSRLRATGQADSNAAPLQELPPASPLTLAELRRAAAALPRLVLPPHHDGIRGIVLPDLPLGTRYVGDPKVWPCAALVCRGGGGLAQCNWTTERWARAQTRSTSSCTIPALRQQACLLQV
jgi:hypothetical protein